MNKKLIPLIGIGALAGSAAWLLAKKHLKKLESSEFVFEDDPLLDYSDPDFREIDPHSRINPGSDKRYSGHILNYELRDALRLLFSTYSDEEIAEYSVWCIEPGHHLVLGDELQLGASDTWNRLSADVKNGILTVLAFGRPGNSSRIGGSDGSQTVATQLLIWEMVCGARNPVTFELYNDCILNCICAGGHHPEVRAVYNNIVNYMMLYKKMPSFANGSTQSMTYENGKYSVTLTDNNGVLSDCSVTASNSSIKVTKSGNTLTLTSSDYIEGEATITLTKSSGISASAQLVTYGDPSLQDVIVGIAKPDDVVASFKVKTPGGNLNIIKTSEDGRVDNITMTVTGNGLNQTVKTGADGTILLKGLVPGTYTVTEQVADFYIPQPSQKVTVVAGQTVNVSFDNILKKGSVSVVKNAEDQFNAGMKFHLYGTSASGLPVDAYAITDENGVAIFNDILIGTNAGYTLEEVETAVRYVTPDTQNVKVFWDETSNTVVPNILKKFNVSINKSDAESGTSQGDGTLAGAVYGLYNGDELVEQLVTDANGYATSGYYICGDSWTIREISPSEGYLLDETVYPVGASPSLYTIEYNSAPSISSPEQVVKGQIAIIKHHDDGSTQIETPEEGASFQVFLSRAGSYDNARETERDTLICDADGFAISKELPYGQYTVHQTAGYPETEMMPDFTVFIAKNGEVYKFLINNANFTAFLKVVKADAETGQAIPLSGAGFQIYDTSGNKVVMQYTYPTLTEIDTFYVSDDGSLLTPEDLPAGDYTLVEVQAPYGYVLDNTPIPFTVTNRSYEEEGDLNVISVTVYDMPQKGKINVFKSGEVFSSVNMTGDTVPGDKDGTTTVLINQVYTPIYETKPLPGASYRVIAADDIYTGDGTLRASAGDVVAEITTGEDGTASTDELYLGRYLIVEYAAPFGYTINPDVMEVTLSYAGQEVSVTATDASFVNDRQKVEIDAYKAMETSNSFGIGMNGEVTAVSFGLYAAEDITALDGSKIPADGLIEIAFADEEGHIVFTSDLPFGEYYAKEISTAPHYEKDENVYALSFQYTDQMTTTQYVRLNGGEWIVNELLLGRVEGVKVDESDEPLVNAVFGLFPKETEEFTFDSAILTTVSDDKGQFVFDEIPLGDYVVVEIDENPTKKLSAKGGIPQKGKEALTDEQAVLLLDSIKGLPPYVFVMLGLYAGLRREEILALKWDCVFLDVEAPYLSVRRAWHTEHNRPVILTELKTKAAYRDVPLPKCLVECLREAKDKSTSEFVIANSEGEPLSYTQFKRVWQYIVTRSTKERTYVRYVNGEKIKHTISPVLGEVAAHNGKVTYSMDFQVTPHQLRHTYITNLIYAQVDPKTVQYLAGHENSKITMDIYAKVKYNKPKELAAVVNGAFGQ